MVRCDGHHTNFFVILMSLSDQVNYWFSVKNVKISVFLPFFSKEPGNRFVVVCACEKGEESGGKDKTAVGQLEMPRILIWPLLL